jgi:hypothetical protein
MIDPSSGYKPRCASSSPRVEGAPIVTARSLPPPGCKQPHYFGTPSGDGVWVRCGRAPCCIECRLKWAWKHALCLVRSALQLAPDFFAVVLPKRGQTNVEYGERFEQFLRGMKRRAGKWLKPKGGSFEYCRVSEWRNGVRHDHLLIRAACTLGQLREWASEAAALAGVRVRLGKVRSDVGCCRYIVKDTRRPDRRPELPPPGYRGRVIVFSRGFLVMPLKHLWKQVCSERVEAKVVPLSTPLRPVASPNEGTARGIGRESVTRRPVGRAGWAWKNVLRLISSALRLPRDFAPIAPADHRCPLISTSRGFPILPVKCLWPLVCRESAARKGAPNG